MIEKIFRFLKIAHSNINIYSDYTCFFRFFSNDCTSFVLNSFPTYCCCIFAGVFGITLIIRKESKIAVISGYSTTIFCWLVTLMFLYFFISKP